MSVKIAFTLYYFTVNKLKNQAEKYFNGFILYINKVEYTKTNGVSIFQ